MYLILWCSGSSVTMWCVREKLAFWGNLDSEWTKRVYRPWVLRGDTERGEKDKEKKDRKETEEESGGHGYRMPIVLALTSKGGWRRVCDCVYYISHTIVLGTEALGTSQRIALSMCKSVQVLAEDALDGRLQSYNLTEVTGEHVRQELVLHALYHHVEKFFSMIRKRKITNGKGGIFPFVRGRGSVSSSFQAFSSLIFTSPVPPNKACWNSNLKRNSKQHFVWCWPKRYRGSREGFSTPLDGVMHASMVRRMASTPSSLVVAMFFSHIFAGSSTLRIASSTWPLKKMPKNERSSKWEGSYTGRVSIFYSMGRPCMDPLKRCQRYATSHLIQAHSVLTGGSRLWECDLRRACIFHEIL